jgi:hypothetical protein
MPSLRTKMKVLRILKACLMNFNLVINKKVGFIAETHFAETARFELAIQFPVYTLSRRAPSTTRTRLLIERTAKVKLFIKRNASQYARRFFLFSRCPPVH